jgi:hypothetical protein
MISLSQWVRRPDDSSSLMDSFPMLDWKIGTGWHLPEKRTIRRPPGQPDQTLLSCRLSVSSTAPRGTIFRPRPPLGAKSSTFNSADLSRL